MNYTLEETVKLLKGRIKVLKENYDIYCSLYKEHCQMYDIELAEKYHRWMNQEYAVLAELKYLYETIIGKEYE